MANTTAVVNQLRALYNLTRIEVATTRARASQAGTAGFRRELLGNAAAATGRAERIGQVLKRLGAAPDPVTAAVGWASTAVRTALEQAQPLDQALLGDLALQHQLAERARYLLTRAGDVPSGVQELAAGLVDDHLETIDRLRHLLAELASGGHAALRPTPVQALTVGVVRVATLPARLTLAGVQRVAGGARRGRQETGQQAAGPLRPSAGRSAPADAAPPTASTGAEPMADVVPLITPAATASPADLDVEPAEVDPAGAAARDAAADIAADADAGVDLAASDLELADVETTLADLEPVDAAATSELADVEADLAADVDSDLDADIAPEDVEAVDIEPVDTGAIDATDAIDAEAGDIKTTVSDPDAEVETPAEAALTVTDPYAESPDLAVDAEPTATEPPVGPDSDEIATEAARWDDDDLAATGTAGSGATDDLPIPDYDALPVRDVVIALRAIDDDADLTAVEQYERSHKNRAGVLTAVQNRTEALAHDTARG